MTVGEVNAALVASRGPHHGDLHQSDGAITRTPSPEELKEYEA